MELLARHLGRASHRGPEILGEANSLAPPTKNRFFRKGTGPDFELSPIQDSISVMEQTLNDLLTDETAEQIDKDLERTEAALADHEGRDPDLDAALTALIWRRRVRGPRGIVGSLIYEDCLDRIDRIPDDLNHVGASQAARRFHKLREACPLTDRQLGPGLIDWLDTDFNFARAAGQLDEGLRDVGPVVLAFLRERPMACAEIPVPPERKGLLARLFRLAS